MKLLLRRLHLFGALLIASCLVGAGSAWALPALQLGPSGSGWTYDAGTQTWVNSGSSFTLAAYANATTALGGNGAYAWESDSDPLVAYLVVSAMPNQTDPPGGDVFNIGISGASFSSSGYGVPPISDPNDLGPHGIFSTYYEVYTFEFMGPPTVIDDTQPGGTGSGQGYEQLFGITINSLADAVDNLHFDLYTVNGDGQVVAFAPFSHDAETALVPEPSAALLFGVGGLIAGVTLRRRR